MQRDSRSSSSNLSPSLVATLVLAGFLAGFLASFLACGATAERSPSERTTGESTQGQREPSGISLPGNLARTPAPEAASLLPATSPPSPDSVPQPAPGLSAFARELLAAHNACRAPFAVKELTWSQELAEFAGEWAETLADSGRRLEHRQNNPYGENLYWISGAAATADQVLESWCSEQKLYDPQRNDWWPSAGHFTQVVWHSTERVGCAVARRGSQEWWVCNYDPPGNIRGRSPY